jgi:hypothetical protein
VRPRGPQSGSLLPRALRARVPRQIRKSDSGPTFRATTRHLDSARSPPKSHASPCRSHPRRCRQRLAGAPRRPTFDGEADNPRGAVVRGATPRSERRIPNTDRSPLRRSSSWSSSSSATGVQTRRYLVQQGGCLVRRPTCGPKPRDRTPSRGSTPEALHSQAGLTGAPIAGGAKRLSVLRCKSPPPLPSARGQSRASPSSSHASTAARKWRLVMPPNVATADDGQPSCPQIGDPNEWGFTRDRNGRSRSSVAADGRVDLRCAPAVGRTPRR